MVLLLVCIIVTDGVIFTLSEQREVLQQQAGLTGGSAEHRVYGQPQERQETEKKTELQLW